MGRTLSLQPMDIPLTDPYFWTIQGPMRVTQMCYEPDLTWRSHSNNHLDVSLTTFTYIAVAAPGKITVIDIHWIWQEGNQHLTKQLPGTKGGVAQMSSTPNLGVELDMDRVVQTNELYKKHGLNACGDAMAMQYLIPGWAFDNERPCMMRQMAAGFCGGRHYAAAPGVGSEQEQHMKIVIVPGSWEGGLDALKVTTVIEQGLCRIYPDAKYIKLSVADGGEGTVETTIAMTGGHQIPLTITGPLGEPVETPYGLSGDHRCTFIEMTAINGLENIPPAQRNPLLTTSWGTRRLVRHVLNVGVRQITIGIDGSATNDDGTGMAQALGAKLLTADDQQTASGNGALEALARIDPSESDPRLADHRTGVACDVTDPLTGPQGAGVAFGPQKGTTTQMTDRLDSGLLRYTRIIARDLDIDILNLEGGDAVGDTGAALYTFYDVTLHPGIEVITDTLQLAARVADVDLVIAGEGHIDSQTIRGKVSMGVAKVAKRFNVPVTGITGSLTVDVGMVHQRGPDTVSSVLYTIRTPGGALANAAANLQMTARNVATVLQMGDRR